MKRHRDSTIFGAGLSILAAIAMVVGGFLSVPVRASSGFEISTSAIKALQGLIRPGGLVGFPSSATDPQACSTANVGATYFNSTTNTTYTCFGAAGWTASANLKVYSWTNAQVVALGASLTGDITLVTLPAKTVVKNAYVVITGQGSGTTTLTVAVGRVAAGYIDYIVASDAKAAANTVYGDGSAERGTNLTGYDLPSYTGTTVVNAHFISTVENLSAVTGSSGSVIIETQLIP